MVVQPLDKTSGERLTGQITAHRMVTLSFRVPGKMVERSVLAGNPVRQGQILARLDDATETQTLLAATADAQSARAALAQMTPLKQRATALLPDHAVSRNDYDDVIRRYRMTQETVLATEARQKIAAQQLERTRLRADADGIITDRLVEVGEVVAAGQPIMRMADSAGRDAQFDIPADFLRSGLTTGTLMTVCLDANRQICANGTLYELSPDSDPLTRTYRARVVLQDTPAAMTLGSVAVGCFSASPHPDIHLPPAALTAQNGQPAVWVVMPDTMTVTLRPVGVAQYAADDVTIASGLKAGERIVTAGVQALYPGKKVSLLDESHVRP
ncbi:efflux RND transporter periplasmic adaptor subunit [Gluconobacter morbifer]|uniref:Multidrug resistance protein mdtA n=1 Tax=Gluconobacter morbifer G707 TaxID=1088869 RepID=G6XHH6_9PROT|nr:efflux RND transporter periplasmic adaptor subunit [Gluconobacter morbifer]EHH69634.1 multidrug resistance protein mdtA [Gluconobacter morbifer G707]